MRRFTGPRWAPQTPPIRKFVAFAAAREYVVFTHDLDFEKWANKVWNLAAQPGGEVSLKDFRKDIAIMLYNEAGQLVISYKVMRAWVSEYQALPDLDANANAVALEHLKLEHEGWERDDSVSEPTEPSF